MYIYIHSTLAITCLTITDIRYYVHIPCSHSQMGNYLRNYIRHNVFSSTYIFPPKLRIFCVPGVMRRARSSDQDSLSKEYQCC